MHCHNFTIFRSLYDKSTSIIWNVCDLQYQHAAASAPEPFHIPVPFRQLVTSKTSNTLCTGEQVVTETVPVEGTVSEQGLNFFPEVQTLPFCNLIMFIRLNTCYENSLGPVLALTYIKHRPNQIN